MAIQTVSLVGQERARRLLSRDAASGSIAHAYLFIGPDGVGKSTAARWWASWLNCAAPGPAGPCGACAACRKIAAGIHPDVCVVQPDSSEGEDGEGKRRTIAVEQIRTLIDSLLYRPLEGRTKVYLILDAHRMTDGAANAFLKSLEEPPRDTVFVLVASSLQMPPTILSRCRPVPFGLLSREDVAAVLGERLGASEEDALRWAAVAEGRPGRAAALLARPALAELRGRALDAVAGLATGDYLEALEAALSFEKTAEKSKEDLDRILEWWLSWFRDLLMLHASAEPSSLVNGDRLAALQAAVEEYSDWEIVRCLEAVLAARRALARNGNSRLVMQGLCLTLVEQ